MKRPNTIAIIGSGAVGSYYGARLAEAGHDVRFLMRRDYEPVKHNGLRVSSIDGDLHLEHPAVYFDSREIGKTDWVICALKSTSINEARRLLEPCIAPDTRVLVLMNGLGLEELFASWFGSKRIFGGLAFTCINRGEPGHVHHMAYGPVTIGHFLDDPQELARAMELWHGSRTTIIESPSLLRSRWEKLCWNIPFNGLAVLAGGITTDKIVGDPVLRKEAHLLMEEVISAGNADLASRSEETRIDGEAIISRMFELTDTMGAYRPSTMIDFVEGKTMEVDAIFDEPLRRAISLGIDTPRLSLVTAAMRSLNINRT